MASVTDEEIRQRQLALSMYLGEVFAVDDPETGVAYYGPTQLLTDMMEGRCATADHKSRPRHAKEAPHGWRLRFAMMMIAGGIVVVAALPATASMASRPSVYRVIDDGQGDSTTGGPEPRATSHEGGHATSTHVPPPVSPAPAPARRGGKIAQLFAPGVGRHRASHKSNSRSATIGGRSRRPWGWMTSAQVGPAVGMLRDLGDRERGFAESARRFALR